MQGKENHVIFAFLWIRITPACAGKSIIMTVFNVVKEDHPCVCREKEQK